MKLYVYLSLIFNILYCSSVLANEHKWQNFDYIIQSFFEVALGSEHGVSRNNNLRKWKDPIRIYVEHQVGDKKLHNQLLNEQIKQLKIITNLDIKRVTNKNDANIFYFFTRQSSLENLVENHLGNSAIEYLHGAICLANIKTDKHNFITTAHIFIPIDQARMHGKLVACIVEEITQALGLVRDSELVFPSIFNDKTRNTLITGLDEILLRLLSEKNIHAGMSAEQLKPILRQHLKNYQALELIKTADSRVQRGRLYEMLGYRPRN